MPVILNKLPYFTHATTAFVNGTHVPIKAHQIIAWVSIGLKGNEQLPPNARRFPAVLDTGHNHNFSISEEQLFQWTGFTLDTIPPLGHVRLKGQQLPLLAANVWIHRNRPGQRDEFTNHPPFGLELISGIAVYPQGTANVPRLPILGLRGLHPTELQLSIDCRRCRVSLRTPRRFWFFG